MKNYIVQVPKFQNQIHQAVLAGFDHSVQGLDLTNYYLEKDGKPFFVISGEAHFSRMQAENWEDEILKMKAGGLNTIATYVFWIHHEETEGVFDWTGNRDLRRFLRNGHRPFPCTGHPRPLGNPAA